MEFNEWILLFPEDMPTSIALKPGLLVIVDGSVAPWWRFFVTILLIWSTNGAYVCINIQLLKFNINHYFMDPCVFTWIKLTYVNVNAN